ncbi:Ni/Fe hydrogenase subunit alpha [Polyangium sp. y55x31]|uniref:Ni/Fe hydrogenase subunit alpha n=1 Tax=Polyangium sp. y55x31 TaxID=3042688 RepID=UPI002482828E|nr:Ni/Fe hydrogenase subunit alpha [Polyangium sp. y55x31]MDI1476325.1 Ni/Fe hydrogenase subunit alpha [Polyangium sp. y55x31]
MARTIKVDSLARVEGEGALIIRFKGDKPTAVELRIFEPPRFFEAFLRGRAYLEVPDIVARICGICPVAYQMSACHAIEDALGIRADGMLRALRRLLYCGEWIESHGLHVFMLHAPDFLGYEDAIAMAKDHREWVTRGLGIKKAGNAIVAALGGREIHPINVKVGGFYRVPTRAELSALLPVLETALGDAELCLDWAARFDFPAFERDYEFVALRHAEEYPFCEGRIVSNKGLDIDLHAYEEHFAEQQVPHSTALHSVVRGRGDYQCGPLARFNLNFDRLGGRARDAAQRVEFVPPCHNVYKSLLARMVEIIQALDEAIRIIHGYAPPDAPAIAVAPRRATGHGCTEAPRGMLWHKYTLDEAGLVEDARIVPPTSQNQKCIEQDLWQLAPTLAAMPHAAATRRAEQAVRNFDPCISCSTHFLRLAIERED